MRTSELLQAMASWLESPNNEAMLLAEHDENCLKIVAESCTLAAALLKNAADEVDVLEPTKKYRASFIAGNEEEGALLPQIEFMAKDNHDAFERANEIAKDLGDNYDVISVELIDDPDASKLTGDSIEGIANLATALDSSGDPELKKQASVLDELLLTVCANPRELTEKRAAADRRLEDLKKKYQGNAETLKEIGRQEESEKAIKKSKMTDEVKIHDQPLSTRSCPDHHGAQLQRLGDHVWQCCLDRKIYDYEAGFTLENGQKVNGGDVSLQTQNSLNVPVQALFDSREGRLGSNKP